MIRSKFAYVTIAGLGIVACLTSVGTFALRNAWADPPAPPAPPAKAPEPPADNKGNETDSLDLGKWRYDSHTGISRSLGKWTYTRDDMVITGTNAVMNRKQDTLDTDSPVEMDDKKHHITADRVHIEHVEKDKTLRVVTLTGHVVLILKPETEPQKPTEDKAKDQDKDKDRQKMDEQRKHGGRAVCDSLDYKTNGKVSILRGHVVFTQSFKNDDGKQVDRKATCEHAEHDAKQDTLHLFKPVHYEDSENQRVDTPDDIVIGTKEGEETIEGSNIRFILPRDKDEDDKNPPKGKSQPARKDK